MHVFWNGDAPPSRIVRSRDGVDLWTCAAGPADAATTIVLIHGIQQDTSAFFRQFRGQLSAASRLIGFDLRGHGLSGTPADARGFTDGALWADDVARVIDAYAADGVILLGWSYGGRVVCDYLRHAGPRRLRGVVFSGVLFGDPARHRLPAGYRDRAVTAALAAPAGTTRAMLSRQVDNGDLLRGLSLPALVLHGADDQIVSASTVADACALMPGARSHIFAGSGHAPFIDRAAEFDHVLQKFARATVTTT